MKLSKIYLVSLYKIKKYNLHTITYTLRINETAPKFMELTSPISLFHLAVVNKHLLLSPSS